jgi:hypothetical protein
MSQTAAWVKVQSQVKEERMATYLIGYEGRGDRPYDQLQDAIASRGGTRLLEALWGLECDDDATQLRDWVHDLMDDADAIFVVQINHSHHWATRHVKTSANDWLKTHL